MKNNHNTTTLTLLFSPNCLKCAIVNLKYAKKASMGPSFCPLFPWRLLQGAMHAAWAAGVLAWGKGIEPFPASGAICFLGCSKVNGWILRAGWMVLARRMQRARQKEGATNAVRCVARCNALRWLMQHAALAYAPHCIICPKMKSRGREYGQPPRAAASLSSETASRLSVQCSRRGHSLGCVMPAGSFLSASYYEIAPRATCCRLGADGVVCGRQSSVGLMAQNFRLSMTPLRARTLTRRGAV